MRPPEWPAMVVNQYLRVVNDLLTQFVDQIQTVLGVLPRPVVAVITAHGKKVRATNSQIHRWIVINKLLLPRKKAIGVRSGTHWRGGHPAGGLFLPGNTGRSDTGPADTGNPGIGK